MVYNPPALPGAGKSNAMLRHLSKPIRVVFLWQLAATAVLVLAAAVVAGKDGAISAAAGGAISMIAGIAAAFVASRGRGKSAGGVVVGALMAEAVKLGVAVVLLWLVLVSYPEAVIAALLGTFVATMLIFAMAFFVREY
jgi:ATP synthase protein I